MKKIFAFALLIVAFAGCSTGGPRTVSYPNQINPQIQAQFKQAEQLYMDRKFVEADPALANFISTSPYTELTDQARFMRGEIAFSSNDYNSAVKFYRESYTEIASPNIEPKSRFKTALSLYRLKRPSEALEEISVIQRNEARTVLRLRIDSLGAEAAAAANQSKTKTVLWYLRLLDDYAEGVTPPAGVPEENIISEQDALAKIKTWMDDSSIGIADVESLPLKEMKGKRSGGYVFYKQAFIYHSTGNTAEAKKLLRNYISSYSKHEYYGSARTLMTELGGEVGETSGVVVGVVLPLSGRFGVYGESVLHGIECAMGLYEPCAGPSGMTMLVRDSASFPGGVAAAISDLANNKDVIAIAGPLASVDVMPAAQRAQELGIPLISLSQREGVAELGDYTFRNSVSPSSEMATLVKYAVMNKKLKKFFIIYPKNNKKAEEYFRLFSESVKNEGGQIVGSKSYDSKQLQPVNDLRGRGAVENAEDRMAMPGLDVSAGGVAYDAIFIPDAAWVVTALAPLIGQNDTNKAQILGISRWNDSEATKESTQSLEGAIFVDSFYRGAPDTNVSSFVLHFKEAYSVDPTFLEALGYDTMRIIIDAVQHKGAARRDSVRDAIARTNDFPGVAGKTSFNEHGEAMRQMWVLTVKNGEITLVK